MNNVILDASALIALLKGEKGSDMVEGLLGRIIMSAVNVSETAGFLITPQMGLDECQNYILPFISTVIPFDEEQAFQVGALKGVTKEKGLSLGDRACIALGMKMKLPVYTADKVWAELNLGEVIIHLIR